MAEFCPNCGKLLAEDEICDCGIETIRNNEKTTSNNKSCKKTSEKTKVQCKGNPEETHCTCTYNTSGILKCFFAKPYSCTLKSYKHISFATSMALVFIQAITACIFSFALINLLSGKNSIWLPFIDRIFGLGGWSRYWAISSHIPYMEIFIKVILLVFILFFILAGLFYIAGKLFGDTEGSFKRVISVLSISSVIGSIFFLIAAILLSFLPSLIFFLFLFSMIFTILLNHAGICDVFCIHPNKGMYSTGLVYFLYFLIINLFAFETLINVFRNL